eukprot:TRINITY_DN69838_c0_g1_i1.p1 TRINITY_DN69838_c0_g1~~TRINITY_DN69838_c0_g1_i1.p1  ORF type:complete len:336 (-),score=56.03 TRINITY_DN69838_c0_g1_i1:35-1042(-)
MGLTVGDLTIAVACAMLGGLPATQATTALSWAPSLGDATTEIDPVEAPTHALVPFGPKNTPTSISEEVPVFLGDGQSESVITQDPDGNTVMRFTTCDKGTCKTVTRTGKASPGMLAPKEPRIKIPEIRFPRVNMDFGFEDYFDDDDFDINDYWDSWFQEGRRRKRTQKTKRAKKRSMFDKELGSDTIKTSDFGVKFPKGTTEQSFDHFKTSSESVDKASYVKNSKLYEKTKRCINGKCVVETSVTPQKRSGTRKRKDVGKRAQTKRSRKGTQPKAKKEKSSVAITHGKGSKRTGKADARKRKKSSGTKQKGGESKGKQKSTGKGSHTKVKAANHL